MVVKVNNGSFMTIRLTRHTSTGIGQKTIVITYTKRKVKTRSTQIELSDFQRGIFTFNKYLSVTVVFSKYQNVNTSIKKMLTLRMETSLSRLFA